MSMIIHTTPGLIDTRSFTEFGLSAKITSKPIGQFGTGLKYAIAILLREGAKVQLFIGNKEYEFYTQTDTFRDIEYQPIFMKKRRGLTSKWTAIRLPFTINYAKNWKVWQAFRELHSNTLDEGGTTIAADTFEQPTENTHTTFVITHPEYVKTFHNMESIFLNLKDPLEETKGIQIYNTPGKHIYYRGIRVFDLPGDKQSIYTYNILEMVALTEDRTLASLWDVLYVLAKNLIRIDNERIISNITSPKDKKLEEHLSWDGARAYASATFDAVLKKKLLRGGYVSHYAGKYYTTYLEPPPVDKIDFPRNLWEVMQGVLKKRDVWVTEELIDALSETFRFEAPTVKHIPDYTATTQAVNELEIPF